MIKIILSIFLAIIGIGFLYKAITGSNNETQMLSMYGTKQEQYTQHYIYWLHTI